MHFFAPVRQSDNSNLQRYTYKKVGGEEADKFTWIKDNELSKSSRIRSLLAGTVVAILTVVCIGAIIWWPSRLISAHEYNTITDDNIRHSCGGTVAEAQERGCKWDLLAAAWLPQACIDEELTNGFRDERPWRYFADRNGTEELFEPELQYRVGPNDTYYTTLEYHRMHCNYQWRKMHRAMQRGTRIESGLAKYHHTLHCGFVGLQEAGLQDLTTVISVEFMECYATYSD